MTKHRVEDCGSCVHVDSIIEEKGGLVQNGQDKKVPESN